MRIFHIAERSRWDAAQLAGAYAWSTLDRTLEQEGFIHAAREDQWEAVRDRYYADVRRPLVLLVIDTDKLTSPWSEEPVGDDTYPHVHGPLNPTAVVDVRPLPVTPATGAAPADSFFRVFLGELLFRMLAAIVIMAASLAAYVAVAEPAGSWAGLAALVAVLVAGTVIATVVYRRRNARAADHP